MLQDLSPSHDFMKVKLHAGAIGHILWQSSENVPDVSDSIEEFRGIFSLHEVIDGLLQIGIDGSDVSEAAADLGEAVLVVEYIQHSSNKTNNLVVGESEVTSSNCCSSQNFSVHNFRYL